MQCILYGHRFVHYFAYESSAFVNFFYIFQRHPTVVVLETIGAQKLVRTTLTPIGWRHDRQILLARLSQIVVVDLARLFQYVARRLMQLHFQFGFFHYVFSLLLKKSLFFERKRGQMKIIRYNS